MTILTANGSFAAAYLNQFEAEVVSFRELDEATFIDKIKHAKTIIHNASTVECDELDTCLRNNFDFTRFLVEQIQKVNPGVHLVHLSSMSILDPSNDKVYGDVLNMSPYSYSKYLAETFCLKSELKHMSCVRFSTLFYKNPKKDGLSRLIADAVNSGKITILNKGEARRNFLPLDIAVQYVSKIVSSDEEGQKIYTLAADQSTSFKDVASLLKKHVPGLEIEDKEALSMSPVLSEFSPDSIKALGPIRFFLEDEIIAYINALQS